MIFKRSKMLGSTSQPQNLARLEICGVVLCLGVADTYVVGQQMKHGTFDRHLMVNAQGRAASGVGFGLPLFCSCR